MSKRLALLIGNVHYQDGRLYAPVPGKDLTALADVLRDPGRGHFDEVFVLVNKPAVDVQLAIAEFFEESHSPDDLLLIYFAGHALHHQGQPYLATGDTFTEHYLDATSIQADYVRRRLALSPVRHKVVMLDCRVSALLEGDGLPSEPAWLGQAFDGAGAVVAVVSRPYPPADEPAHSRFTPALVEGMRTGAADENGDGQVTAAEWFAYAQAQATSEQYCHLFAPEQAAQLIVSAAPEGKKMPLTPALETVVPSPRRSLKPYAMAALVVLLLLLVGGLYRSGVFPPTAVTSTHTPTLAVAAVLPLSAPSRTPTPTKPTAPTMTPSPRVTETATKPGTKATDTAVPAPSLDPAITPSPTASSTVAPSVSAPTGTAPPLGVHVVRQLIFMRSGPAINFRILDYLPEGTAVTVLGRTESGEWYNVQLADGRSGWVFSEMVQPPADEDPNEIPIAATLPAPMDEFYDFVAQPTADGLTITVDHVYVGTQGEEGTFTAELLPETTLIAPTYENGQALGLGQFVVRFARVGEGEYTSTAVRLCMVSTTGQPFFCETYSASKEW